MDDTENYDEQMKKEPATLGDLETWGGQLQYQMQGLDQKIDETKREIIEETRRETKRDIREAVKEIIDHIDVAVENRQVDVGAASGEQVEMLQQRVDDHEERLSVVEKRV